MKDIKKIADLLVDAFRRGKKLLICGNGGSAAMAQHLATELVCKFEKERRPLPAIALTTDASILTALSNDNRNGFETVFSRQVEALGQAGDILLVLSTSGRSKNCLRAIDVARLQKMEVVDFPRQGTGAAAIQEHQLKLLHEVCRLIEAAFV